LQNLPYVIYVRYTQQIEFTGHWTAAPWGFCCEYRTVETLNRSKVRIDRIMATQSHPHWFSVTEGYPCKWPNELPSLKEFLYVHRATLHSCYRASY